MKFKQVMWIALGFILLFYTPTLAASNGQYWNYSGAATFTVPDAGLYQFELQGGGASVTSWWESAAGGVSSGKMELKKGQVLYLNQLRCAEVRVDANTLAARKIVAGQGGSGSLKDSGWFSLQHGSGGGTGNCDGWYTYPSAGYYTVQGNYNSNGVGKVISSTAYGGDGYNGGNASSMSPQDGGSTYYVGGGGSGYVGGVINGSTTAGAATTRNVRITLLEKSASTGGAGGPSIVSVVPSTTEWTNGDVSVTVTAEDIYSGINGSTTQTKTATKNETLFFTFTNGEGVKTTYSYTVTNIDKIAPTVMLSVSPNIPWTNSDVTVTATAIDSDSGIHGDTAQTEILTENGTVSFTFFDNAGNETTKTYTAANIDKISPTMSITASVPHTTWTNQDVIVTATGSDTGGAGLTGAAKQTQTFTANGTAAFTFTDKAGNTDTDSYTVTNIDKTPPSITITTNPSGSEWTNEDIVVTATATDSGSGIDGETTQTKTITRNETVSFSFTDIAGNLATKAYTAGNVDKAGPTISIVASPPNSIWTNGNVLLTATATDNGSGISGENVQTVMVSANGTSNFTFQDDLGNQSEKSYTTTNIDKAKPMITFSDLPASNSVSSFVQTLTLTDTGSGIAELKIDGVPVLSFDTNGTVTASYAHNITQNKVYEYSLTDFAGNPYTTTQTVKSIRNNDVTLTPPVLSGYKLSLIYEGVYTFVINGSYSYSDIRFSMADVDTTDFWTYKIELKDSAGNVVQTISKNPEKLGSFTERISYIDSDTRKPVSDGVYTLVVTASDGLTTTSSGLQIIVKRSMPPKPTISLFSNTVSINYPPDMFDSYAENLYTYNGTTQTYAAPFSATVKGLITATKKDIAGNTSTAILSVDSIPAEYEDITPPYIDPDIGGGGGIGGDGTETGDQYMVDSKEFIIYYINTRQGTTDNGITNSILELVQ